MNRNTKLETFLHRPCLFLTKLKESNIICEYGEYNACKNAAYFPDKASYATENYSDTWLCSPQLNPWIASPFSLSECYSSIT